MSDGTDRAAPRTRYRLRLSDILISLFILFCVMLVVGAFLGTVLRPYVSQEEFMRPVAVLVLWTISSLALVLAGAGWARHLGRFGFVVVSFASWFMMSAGLHGYFDVEPWAAIPVSVLLFLQGRHYANSKWVERAVIIKRNARYEEAPVLSADDHEASKYLATNE